MYNIKLKSSDIKKLRAAFHIFLIISYMSAFSSCMTTYDYSVFPDNIRKVNSSEITMIELNNGTIIDCNNTIIKFEKGADSVKYIILKSYTVGEKFETYWTEKKIPEEDVYKIYMERSEVNGTQTTFLVSGFVLSIRVDQTIISDNKVEKFPAKGKQECLSCLV